MTEVVIKDIKDARLIKSGGIVSIALPKPTDGSWSVKAPVINPNDCGKIGGWDIPENEDIPIEIVRCKDCKHWKLNYYDDVETCFEHRNVDGTEQATRPDDFCSWGKRRTNGA